MAEKEGVFVDTQSGETFVRDGESFKPSGPLEFSKSAKGEEARATLGRVRSGARKSREIQERARRKKLAEAKRKAEAAKKRRAEALMRKKIELARLAKKTRQRALKKKKTETSLGKKITRGERLSLIARADLTKAARARGKGFTRLQTERFLKQRGGSIAELRKVRAKGFRFEETQIVKAEKLVKQITNLKKESQTPSVKKKVASLKKGLSLLGFSPSQTLKGLNKLRKSVVKGFKKIPSLEREVTRQLTPGEIKSRLTKQEKDLKDIQSKIRKAKGSEGKFKKLNLRRLKTLETAKKELIAMTSKGIQPGVLTGDLPLVPSASIPAGVTKIFFTGKQRFKDGKILTDVVFITSKGRVGKAKGLTAVKDKKGFSVIAGRSGKVAIKPLSKKPRAVSIESFVGRELSKSVDDPFKVKTVVDLIKGKKKLGTINIINENLLGLQQRGVGQLATVKGKKFFKVKKTLTGEKLKKAKRISLDDFASIAAVFKNKDIDLILGKTLTRSKARANFLGILKGQKDISKLRLGGGEKQQFQKALTKVISTTSSALAKAEKAKVPKSLRAASASRIISQSLKTGKTLPKVTRPLPKVVAIKSPKQVALIRGQIKKSKSKIRTATSSLAKSQSKVKQLTKTISRTKSRSALKTLQAQKNNQAQRVKLLQTQLQAQKQIQRLRLNQLQRQTGSRGGRPTIPGRPKVPRIILPPKLKLKKLKGVVVKKKTKGSFDVFAKPVKGKKLIKVNKAPLSKIDAEDLRNHIVDTSLSRTGRTKPRKGKARKPVLKVPRGAAKRTAKKFRKFRRVKGKKVPLPKGKLIERRTKLLDTRQERRKITLRRRIKQITPKKKVAKKVAKRNPKITNAQRKRLLQNLKKARIEKARLASLRGASRTTTKRRIISII